MILGANTIELNTKFTSGRDVSWKNHYFSFSLIFHFLQSGLRSFKKPIGVAAGDFMMRTATITASSHYYSLSVCSLTSTAGSCRDGFSLFVLSFRAVFLSFDGLFQAEFSPMHPDCLWGHEHLLRVVFICFFWLLQPFKQFHVYKTEVRIIFEHFSDGESKIRQKSDGKVSSKPIRWTLHGKVKSLINQKLV